MRLLLSVALLFFPFIGKSVVQLNSTEPLAIVLDSPLNEKNELNNEHRFLSQPLEDRVTILNNAQTGYRTLPENSVRYHGYPYHSSLLLLNKIPDSLFKRMLMENRSSSRKRFIWLRVLLI